MSAATTTPRKARVLGPVHLYPEPPKKLASGSRVASVADPAQRGKVRTVNPGDRYVVEWENGTTTVELRTALLSVFTTVSPRPRGAKR